VNYYISAKAKIGNNVQIGPGSIINDNVEIGDNCQIGAFVTIGEPAIGFYKSKEYELKKTVIGANSIIRSHSVIYEDVHIGNNFQSGHYSMIRERTFIGDHSRVGSYSELFGNSLSIGNYVHIHSKVGIGEGTLIEDYVWIFPFTFITNDKYPPHSCLQPCKLLSYSIILSGVLIMPGVQIGRHSLVGAGALVTKDVADERLVTGNPARDVKSVRDIIDVNGMPAYPWCENLKEDRGYPWQTTE